LTLFHVAIPFKLKSPLLTRRYQVKQRFDSLPSGAAYTPRFMAQKKFDPSLSGAAEIRFRAIWRSGDSIPRYLAQRRFDSALSGAAEI
jgi:hypothetical protein